MSFKVFWSCAALATLAAILLFFATGGGILFAMLAVGLSVWYYP
jgi:hypothetical protein